MKRMFFGAAAAAAVLTFAGAVTAQPLTTEFTYQARIRDGGLPANGPHNLRFRVFDAAVVGVQVGPTLTFLNFNVQNGIVTVPLDFGAIFDGDRLWLDIIVNGTPLVPRQELTITPHAGVASEKVDIGGTATTNLVAEVREDPFRDGGQIQLFQDSDGLNVFRVEPDISAGGGTFMLLANPNGASLVLESNADGAGAQILGRNDDFSDTFQILSGGASVLSPGGRGASSLPNVAQYNVLWPATGNIVAQLTAESGFGGPESDGGQLNMFDNLGNLVFNLEPRFDVNGGTFMAGFSTSGNFGSYFLQSNTSGGNAGLSLFGNTSFNVNTANTGNSAVVMATDAVSATEMFNEPGVANNHAFNFGTTINSTASAIISRSITVPAAGYVLAIANGDLQTTHTFGVTSNCGFAVGDTAGAVFGADLDMQVLIPSSAPSGMHLTPASAHGLFSVAAGVNTFYFNGEVLSGSDQTMFDVQLTLVYLPTAYGTVVSNMPGDARALGNAGDAIRGPLTAAEINAERADAVSFDQWRKQSEMELMRAEMADLRAAVDEMRRQQGIGGRRAPAPVIDRDNNNEPPVKDVGAVDEPITLDGK